VAPLLVALATVVVGVVGARAIRRSPIRERHEVPVAVVAAVIAAFLLASFAEIVLAAAVAMDSGIGSEAMLAALPFAAAVGVLSFLGGLAGYAAAARFMRGQAAVVGSVLGALAFVSIAAASLQLAR